MKESMYVGVSHLPGGVTDKSQATSEYAVGEYANREPEEDESRTVNRTSDGSDPLHEAEVALDLLSSSKLLSRHNDAEGPAVGAPEPWEREKYDGKLLYHIEG